MRRRAIQTQVSDSSVSVGDSVTDTATLSGDKGAVEGTVDFFLCGPSSSAPDCSTGGTKVGATKTISNGEATSDSYEADAAGFYCFRADYTPAQGSKYLAASHTNQSYRVLRGQACRGPRHQDRRRGHADGR